MVLRLVAAIDCDLERCLKHKFRKLNTRTEKRIFGTYGPLSTFAARIDLAYALKITTDEIHTELNKSRKIRNVFAHHKGLHVESAAGHDRQLFGSVRKVRPCMERVKDAFSRV